MLLGLPLHAEGPWLMRFQPFEGCVIVWLGLGHGMIYKRLIVRYHGACPPNRLTVPVPHRGQCRGNAIAHRWRSCRVSGAGGS